MGFSDFERYIENFRLRKVIIMCDLKGKCRKN
jgi:hypothetical protein